MSVPMKKLRTETVVVFEKRFEVPKATAKAILVLLNGATDTDEKLVLADESETIRKLDAKYTRPGACLQGARLKEGLSQVDLARRIGVPQTNISGMELGKRPIGKRMAKRLAAVLKMDYRVFL